MHHTLLLVVLMLNLFLQHFAAPVSYSETGTEHLDEADSDTVFIVEEFAGSVFETLHKDECRIVAPPVVIRAAMNNEVICFTVFCWPDR
jgi:hypothetical protein